MTTFASTNHIKSTILSEPVKLGVAIRDDDIHLIWELPRVENVSDIPNAVEKDESVKLTKEEETEGFAPSHSKRTDDETKSV